MCTCMYAYVSVYASSVRACMHRSSAQWRTSGLGISVGIRMGGKMEEVTEEEKVRAIV